jgi:Heterokaryon incompatibility protein (HET)
MLLSLIHGNSSPSVPILVNGAMVLVSENLYLALLHLRKRGSTTLWVDALWINQSDLQERASQVHQMKDIYQRASIVVVWLGDGNNLSDINSVLAAHQGRGPFGSTLFQHAGF